MPSQDWAQAAPDETTPVEQNPAPVQGESPSLDDISLMSQGWDVSMSSDSDTSGTLKRASTPTSSGVSPERKRRLQPLHSPNLHRGGRGACSSQELILSPIPFIPPCPPEQERLGRAQRELLPELEAVGEQGTQEHADQPPAEEVEHDIDWYAQHHVRIGWEEFVRYYQELTLSEIQDPSNETSYMQPALLPPFLNLQLL